MIGGFIGKPIGGIVAERTYLVADVGSYVLTGQAATFRVTFTAEVGSYTITGNAATFTASMPAEAGSYALTGQDAVFKTTFAAAAGSYDITGSAAVFATTFQAAAGAYTITGVAAYLSSEFLGGGGEIVVHHKGDELRSGTPFTKKRYREIQGALQAARDAEKRAHELKRKADRVAAWQAAQQARAAIEAARLAEDQSNQARAHMLALTGALQAMSGAQGTNEVMRNSQGVMRMAAQAKAYQDEQDEEEAISLLLAA